MVKPSELQELIKVLRDNGVVAFKDGELAITLGPLPAAGDTKKSEPVVPKSMNDRLRAAAGEKPRKRE